MYGVFDLIDQLKYYPCKYKTKQPCNFNHHFITNQQKINILYMQPSGSKLNSPKHQSFSFQISKRKIQPLPPLQKNHQIKIYEQYKHQGLEHELQYISNDVQLLEQRYRIEHQFIFNEYFVANCDVGYFQRKDEIGMGEVIKMVGDVGQVSMAEDGTPTCQNMIEYLRFRLIQKCLPKPRLFDKKFIESQRKNLHEFRKTARSQLAQKDKAAKKKNFEQLLNKQNKKILQAEAQVYAFCHLCSHIHTGKILTQNADSYSIKFNDNSLGSLKIPYPQVTDHLLTQKIIPSNTEQLQLSSKTNNFVNIEAFSVCMQLIHLKQNFLDYLRLYINLIKEKKQRNEELGSILQEFGWIGSICRIIQIAIRYIVGKYNVKFRCGAVGSGAWGAGGIGGAGGKKDKKCEKNNNSNKVKDLILIYPNPQLYTENITSQSEADRKNSKKSSKLSEQLIIISPDLHPVLHPNNPPTNPEQPQLTQPQPSPNTSHPKKSPQQQINHAMTKID